LEALEERIAPASVDWTNAAGGNWDVGTNWSTGQVPTTGDDVKIDTAGAATILIQAGDSLSANSVTTTSANDTLSVTGGSLTVTTGTSTLSGPLSMTGGSLTATARV